MSMGARGARLGGAAPRGWSSSPVPAEPRQDEAHGDNWPWIVEEPEDWRTRTAADSRRLRRACAVYGGGLLVGLLLVRLALALSGVMA